MTCLKYIVGKGIENNNKIEKDKKKERKKKRIL